jgi:hypothetical protein
MMLTCTEPVAEDLAWPLDLELALVCACGWHFVIVQPMGILIPSGNSEFNAELANYITICLEVRAC